jgi:hypothetical protein
MRQNSSSFHRASGVAMFLLLGVHPAGRRSRGAPPIADPPIPGAVPIPERTTPGCGKANAGGGRRRVEFARFHPVTLSLDDVLDTVWRDHLSRIRDVAPQPGRNVRLLDRVQL